MPQLEKQIQSSKDKQIQSSKDKQSIKGFAKPNVKLVMQNGLLGPEDYVPAPEDKPKVNVGKYKPHLVTKKLIEAVARVREYGVTKYGGEHGWKMMTVTDYHDAMLRHADDCRNDPYARDEESGVLHIAQVACNCMFILELMGVDLLPEDWEERLNKVREKYK